MMQTGCGRLVALKYQLIDVKELVPREVSVHQINFQKVGLLQLNLVGRVVIITCGELTRTVRVVVVGGTTLRS